MSFSTVRPWPETRPRAAEATARRIRKGGALSWLVVAAAWVGLASMHLVTLWPSVAEGATSQRFIAFCSISHDTPAGWSETSMWHASLALLPMFMLMPVAMMLPTVRPMTAFIEATTLRRLRRRMVTLFLAAYIGVWVVFGLGASLVIAALLRGTHHIGLMGLGGIPLPGLASAGVMVLTLALAAVWQVSPMKRRVRRASHAPRPFPVRGRAADRASLRFGVVHGSLCVASCWPLMLVGAGTGSFPWMVVAAVLVWMERTTRLGQGLTRSSAAMFAVAALAYLVI